jgi:SAM-dependent methyltransferase
MAAFDMWIQSLETRHLSDLRFPEVSRALRALSSTYIERRGTIHHGAAQDGAGKRAAFALFYGPLHYLIVDEIVRHLDSGRQPRALVDLGCGTGAAGAAWAARASLGPVTAIDRNPWSLTEAQRTYRQFDVSARTRQDDLISAPWPPRAAVLAAFSVNELGADGRERLLQRFLERAKRGDTILVVEPIARSIAPWWPGWQEAFGAAGGRADEWRFRPELPAIIAKLDRAAGLDHRELTARSLWLDGR